MYLKILSHPTLLDDQRDDLLKVNKPLWKPLTAEEEQLVCYDDTSITYPNK